jgi:hypothetical protein
MKRRSFFRSLATLFVAPTVLVRAANVITKKPTCSSQPVGFRGSNFLEAGIIYAPYIPLIHSELVYSPENFKQYGKSINTEYYKKITIIT